MSISTVVEAKVTTTQVLTGDDLIAPSTAIHGGYDDVMTLSGSTTPDETKAAYQTVTLSGSTGSIDLTSLLLNEVAVTFDGLQPRAIKIKALSTNAGNMTVTKGASTGYTGLGSSFSTVLKAGEWVMFGWTLDNATAVGSGVKILDLAGTSGDSVQLSTVAGT